MSVTDIIERSGKSQSAIARAAGVTRGAIWMIVHNRRKPSVDVLIRILDACEATDAERLAILSLSHGSAPTTAGQKTPKARPLVPSIRRISKAALASTEARVRAQTAPRGEG